MKLAQLEPQFIQNAVRSEGDGEHRYCVPVETLGEAHGIRFLCPKCFHENGGSVGTHSVICWFEGRVSDDVEPGPGRWNPAGGGYGDLSFVPGRKSHSVLLIGGCAWHGFITNGEAVGGY